MMARLCKPFCSMLEETSNDSATLTGRNSALQGYLDRRSGSSQVLQCQCTPAYPTWRKKKETLYENGTLTQPVGIVEREYKQMRFTPDSCELQETTKKIFGQKLPLHNLVSSTINHLGEQAYSQVNTSMSKP